MRPLMLHAHPSQQREDPRHTYETFPHLQQDYNKLAFDPLKIAQSPSLLLALQITAFVDHYLKID